MFAAKAAVCCREGCNSNANRSPVVVCGACGKCAADSFHGGCTATSGMRGAIVGACGNDGCANATNGLQVLVCSVCGKCGGCSMHGCAP